MSIAIPKLAPAAFVLGTPRAGTTLLRVMLAGHPGIFCPPEMVIAPFETMRERAAHMEARYWEKGGIRRALMNVLGLDTEKEEDIAEAKDAVDAMAEMSIPEVYAYLQERIEGRLLVDKCPHLCARPEAMRRLEGWFPDARYIWIVRHPGSVIRSVQNMPMAEVMLKGYADDPREIWQQGNRIIQDFLAEVPEERWTRVLYEDLVQDPRRAMERVCATLGLPFDDLVLKPYEGDRMREGPKGARAIGDPNLASRGKIDPTLADKWLEGFDPRSVSDATRSLAREMGYDLDAMPLPPMAKLSDAFQSLFASAQALERTIQMPMDLDAAEGRRFLLRMLSASVDTFCEDHDTDRPRFHHAEGPTRKMFADCPDTDYLRAPIRTAEGQGYRIRGRVPEGTLYVGVLLYGKGGRIGNRLDDRSLALDGDRRFEVVIAKERPEGTDDATFLQADGDETAVIVRQYFASREREAAIDVSIERIGEAGPPPPLDPASFAHGVGKAERMLRSIFDRTRAAYEMARSLKLNTFFQIPGEQLFPTPDNIYKAAWYRFGGDQLLFVRGRVPKARYFSLCLYNAWLESYDYRHRRVSLNHDQIQADAEGRFEVCLAHRDVGHPNWIDTAGHRAGFILARSLLPEEDVPDLETQVMYESEWSA